MNNISGRYSHLKKTLKFSILNMLSIKGAVRLTDEKEHDHGVCASSRPYGIFSSGRFQ